MKKEINSYLFIYLLIFILKPVNRHIIINMLNILLLNK